MKLFLVVTVGLVGCSFIGDVTWAESLLSASFADSWHLEFGVTGFVLGLIVLVGFVC